MVRKHPGRRGILAACTIAWALWVCPVTPAAGGQRPAAFTAKVTRVLDGDTIEVFRNGTQRVRIEGVDCPESGQPFSQVARNFTRQLLFDRTVNVRPVTMDRYGRIVARVLVDGQDASLELVRAGLAWHYTTYSSDVVLAAAEREARSAHRGLWADVRPIPPWVQRRPSATAPARRSVQPPTASGPVHGNTRSRVFHLSGCKNYHCANCSAVFRDAAEALAAGYKPAGDCAGRGQAKDPI